MNKVAPGRTQQWLAVQCMHLRAQDVTGTEVGTAPDRKWIFANQTTAQKYSFFSPLLNEYLYVYNGDFTPYDNTVIICTCIYAYLPTAALRYQTYLLINHRFVSLDIPTQILVNCKRMDNYVV